MSDDTFTLKEMVTEILHETKEQSTALTVLSTEMTAVKDHLAKLNSKVATHEKKLNEHDTFFGKITALTTFIASMITVAINKMW